MRNLTAPLFFVTAVALSVYYCAVVLHFGTVGLFLWFHNINKIDAREALCFILPC